MTIEFIHHHRAGVVLAVFLGFAIVCMTLRVDPVIEGLKTVVWFSISPEIVYSGTFFRKLNSLRGKFFKLFSVEGENFILRTQNARMAQYGIERDALAEENNRLRALLTLQQMEFPDSIPAEVVGRDMRDWFHAIMINKGAAHGVAVSAAVVTSSPARPVLVGRILEVAERTAKVLLLTDAVSEISVSVAEKGGIGLLEGHNKPWVSLNYLSHTSQVARGDEVLTIGLGGVFPPGIPVGRVEEVLVSRDGYFKTAQVVPYAAEKSIQEVLILERESLPGLEEEP